MRIFLFIALIIMGFPAQAAGITSVTDIAYGPAPLQKIDVFTPERCVQGGCPVLMWVHGGGWRMGDKAYRGTENLVNSWGVRGAIVVAVNYRLSPDVVHPAHVQDVAAAIAWVKQHIQSYGGNKDRIYLLGHSAGAHLVALVATDPQYLQAYGLHPADALAGVFPIDSASYDLVDSSDEPWVGRMVKQAFGSNRDALELASPLWLVSHNRHERYPPFIFAATKQRSNAVFQMNEMIEQLQRDGATAQGMVVDYPTLRQLKAHGEIARDLSDPTSTMTKRLMVEVGLQP